MDVDFDIADRDFSRLLRAVEILPEKAAGLMGGACLAAARPLEAAARATSRFRDKTGTLRSRIGAEKAPARFPVGGGRWITRQGAAKVRVRAPHAHLVELGHGGPHPARGRYFLQAAIQSTRRDQLVAFANYLRRRVPSLARHSL